MSSLSPLRKAIETGTAAIIAEQQNDGSFISFSSANERFKNAKTVTTPFFTALILSLLLDVTSQKVSNVCKKNAISFLLSQKSMQWTWNYWKRQSTEEKLFPYPDDLDVTFCALAALYQYDNALIDGTVFAKIVMVLTSVEKQEGGPYYTWLVNEKAPAVWRDIDIAVNSNIAFFLSQANITLPNLDIFIEEQIVKKNFISPYYVSIYPTVYFLSRFYKGKHVDLLTQSLLDKQDKKGTWDNPLQTALAISALLNLGMPQDNLEHAISYLLETQKNGLWKPYPFVKELIKNDHIEYGGSSTLTTAFCLQALQKYSQAIKTPRREVRHIPQGNKREELCRHIMKQVEKRFTVFDTPLRQKVSQLIDVLITKDPTKQIPLLPYYFTHSLGDQQQHKIDSSLLMQLGAANVFGWLSYTIFDDFMDKDATDPQLLALAALSLREVTQIFSTVLPKQTDFQTHFNSIMDKIDSANAWELQHCRIESFDTPMKDIVIPHFGDYSVIADKSLGHVLGPVAILCALRYEKDSYLTQQFISFFTHFLIAKQLNDDAHDWEEDLKKGQINPVSALLLKEWKKVNKDKLDQSLPSLLPYLKEYFWFYLLEEVCKMITKHILLARKNLHAMSYIGDPSLFEQFLLPIEQATQKALDERIQMLTFLNTYQQ